MSKPITVKEVLAKDSHFKYQLLSRMEMDCQYYLGNGDRNPKHLWAQNKEEQITFMKEIWKSFPEEEKPEWITFEAILKYETRMNEEGK